jgi:hypothetical protein
LALKIQKENQIKGIKPQGKPWTQNEKVYNPAASGRGIKNHNQKFRQSWMN